MTLDEKTYGWDDSSGGSGSRNWWINDYATWSGNGSGDRSVLDVHAREEKILGGVGVAIG